MRNVSTFMSFSCNGAFSLSNFYSMAWPPASVSESTLKLFNELLNFERAGLSGKGIGL